ncbi:beta-ketoacyl synthase N-terminal-like domain-containing protein [Methylocucumis oryzae]|uniref:beta-ketoacyl synthase N-terminal-like domain-containing protein n=1 Tax=Methylocucumis oryzae TaxID=1632867 RepID=UPI0006990849|nr:beta-ketoacyl synthase N-terminal-like domain-containing protein [Methylocucumis oryzae]
MHLLTVCAEEELDFLLFLSSTVALDKTGGLSGYAAGCAFVDALALSESHRYPVKTLNLGHCAIGTGARLSDASKTRLALSGIRPLTMDDAMPALASLIAEPHRQLALVKTLYPDTLPWLDASLSYYHDDQVHHASIQLAEWVKSESAATLANLSPSSIFQHSQLEQDLIRLLADLAQVLNFKQLKPQGYLARWLAASQHWLTGQVSTAKTLEQVWQHWQQTLAQQGYASDLTAALALVETCMRALPDILAGKCVATDVMFPGASMVLVDGIYQNNRVSDYFNAVLAETLVKFIQTQTPGRTLRILEIGAGTGGTTTRVLARLNDYRDVIAEYCYTDVSKAFLFLGQERFAADYPFLVTQRLDIEQPPGNQGFASYAYDVVIATNVLHATRDIRQTLAHAKTLLRGKGLLLLNEITTPSLYAQLTFGLLEGWWLSADDVLRAPNAPILLAQRWLTVLNQQGFKQACQITPDAVGLGQQVFASLSDGLIVTPSVSVLTQSPAESVTMTAESTQTTAAVLTTVTAKIKTIVAAVLRMRVDAIDTNEALEAYGIDSILIVQMTNRLREVFAEISRTVLFECQTVAALAEYCVKHYPAQAADLLASNPASTPTNTTVTPTIQAKPAPKKLTSESEAIAIIGMSCRFPGADTVEAFWQLLQSGGDAITEVPKQRWAIDDFYLADIEQAIEQGKSYCRWGGFIDNIDAFDAQFFNISPKEAMTIDPQERLFLQTAWSALEDAGITRDQLQQHYRQQVGVFAGITRTGFDLFGPELWQAGKTLYPHTSFSSVANRLSYFLNLRGPSVPVDTMCSSSLTAIHQASQSLLNHECDLAIVGGVNIYQHPSNYVWLSAQRMLSKDGRCKSFAAGANGFVPGEGVAVLVLKRWSDALVDDDLIYAKIRATHINHGGKTNGYTVPNPLAQAELIQSALNKAGVNARAVSYIEAHGTGTELGDPIEMTALTQAFSEDTSDKGFCALGSVKSNIGHLEAAAGVAGVIKTVLQLQHSQIVPSLHADSLNPLIDFANTPFTLARQLSDWTQPVLNGVEQPRIAGVSSFGAGGANAHIVLEEYQAQSRQTLVKPVVALVLSAKNKDRLTAYAEQLCQFIECHRAVCLAELAYTLQIGREAMTERLAFTAASTTEALEKLRAFLAESEADYYVGSSQAHKSVIQVLSDEPGIEQTLAQWFAHQRFDKLLTLWTQGLKVDWSAFYQHEPVKPKRISLPTYPFARQEHRLPSVQAVKPKLVETTTAVQHAIPNVQLSQPVTTSLVSNTLSKPSGITLTAVSAVPTQFNAALTRGLRQLTPLPQMLSHSELSNTQQVRLHSHTEHSNDERATAIIEVINQGQGIYQLAISTAADGFNVESLFIDAVQFLLTDAENIKVLVLSGLPVLENNTAIQRLSDLLTQLSVPVIVVEPRAFSLLTQRLPKLVWLTASSVEQALTLAVIIADVSRLALTTLTQHFIQQHFRQRTDVVLSADWPLALIKTDTVLASHVVLSELGGAKPVALASEVVSLCRYDNGIALITLADKRAKNTFTPEFVDGVLMAFADIAEAQCDKVVVLTGFEQYFACGGTQQGLLAIQQGLAKFTDEQSYCAPLFCELPVLAAMQGHAIGAGWAMGLYCDVSLFSEESRYQSPYLRYGFTPGAGSTLIFPQKLGKAFSFEILYSAQTYTGHELKQRGISQRVLPRERVLPSALAIAAALCQMPRARLIAEKQQRVQELRQQLFTVFAEELAMHDKTFVHNPEVIAKISQHFAQSLSDANNRTPSYGLKAQPATPKPSSNELFNELRASLAEELYLKPDAIDATAVFIDLGMDSISAVTWIRKLNKRFWRSIGSNVDLSLSAAHSVCRVYRWVG